MQTPEIRSFPGGIHTIDTGYIRPGLAASHLLVRDGRAAFVDAGTTRTVPALRGALDALGVAPEAVDYVILTHVHLDHAGGAGALMEMLPGALAVVHPRGAPHLIAPAKLEAAARAVHGDAAYDALYGRLVPIPEARVRAAGDDEVLRLGRSSLRILETPGHALHHMALHDEANRAVFSGDAFGISYRVLDDPAGAPFVFATSSPTQFDPAQSHASVERIRSAAPEAVYLGHFGRVTEVGRLADDLHRDLDRFVAIAAAAAGQADAEDQMARAILGYFRDRLAAHGTRVDAETTATWLAMDARLNAAGLRAWQERTARTGSGAT